MIRWIKGRLLTIKHITRRKSIVFTDIFNFFKIGLNKSAEIYLNDVKIDDFKLIKGRKSLSFILDYLNLRIFERLQQRMKPKPYFIEEKCIKCGKCIEICASNANWFETGPKDKFVAVDYNKCIRCYCCHEICPVDAIEIRK